jgi:hypothetical protein
MSRKTECLEKIKQTEERLKSLQDELRVILKEELLTCYCCKKKSQRQNWSVKVYQQTEEEPGYPVSYHTYFTYGVVCPKCGIEAKSGSVAPAFENLYKERTVIEKKGNYFRL